MLDMCWASRLEVPWLMAGDLREEIKHEKEHGGSNAVPQQALGSSAYAIVRGMPQPS